MPKNKKNLAIFSEGNLHTKNICCAKLSKTLVCLIIKKWSYFLWRTFSSKNICCVKVSAFCFEIIGFSSPGCFQFHIAFTAANMTHGSVLLYRCTSKIFGRQEFKLYICSKIGANFYQVFTFIGKQLLRLAEDWIV